MYLTSLFKTVSLISSKTSLALLFSALSSAESGFRTLFVRIPPSLSIFPFKAFSSACPTPSDKPLPTYIAVLPSMLRIWVLGLLSIAVYLIASNFSIKVGGTCSHKSTKIFFFISSDFVGSLSSNSCLRSPSSGTTSLPYFSAILSAVRFTVRTLPYGVILEKILAACNVRPACDIISIKSSVTSSALS